MNTSSSASRSGLAVVVLAGGKGTRMKSDLPKVLHPLAGKPMLWHILTALKPLNPERIVVVTGHGAELVEENVQADFPHVEFTRQTEQKGTGHAVIVTEDTLKDFTGTIAIIYGDIMLNIREDVLPTLLKHAKPNALACLTAEVDDPTGFGRLFHKNGRLVNVEEKDCSEAERQFKTVNPCIYAIEAKHLWPMLHNLKTNNKQQEYYLTDIIEMAPSHQLEVDAVHVPAVRAEMGINNRIELASMENLLQYRLRGMHMLNGATLLDPATTYFSGDTQIGRDVVIGPQVVFGPGVTVEDNVTVSPFCILSHCTVKKGATVKPFTDKTK